MAIETTLAPIFDSPKVQSDKKELTEGVIIGKAFSANGFIPIKEVNNDTGNCIICGDVFSILEPHEIQKIKKTIVSFYITDYTGSVTCKAFVPSNTADSVLDSLKKTSHVAVKGFNCLPDASRPRKTRML